MRKRAPSAFVGALLLAGTASLQAAAAGEALQFDLICKIRGRLVPQYRPEREGFASYNGAARWKDTIRITVDLKEMTYCNFGPCRPIARVTGDHIVFEDDEYETLSFDRSRRSYRELQSLGPYRAGLTTGSCKYAPFSAEAAARPQEPLFPDQP